MDEGIARPVLVGRAEVVRVRMKRLGLRIKPGEQFDLVDPENDRRYNEYWRDYHQIMERRGTSPAQARTVLRTSSTVIAAHEPSPEGVVVIHSRSHENSRRLAEYFQGRSILERKVCGSALKFGVLAAGEADFYPRWGTTMEWDTAAGQAILEAAGGSVVRVEGGPLAYGKHDLKNDAFLAWGKKPVW